MKNSFVNDIRAKNIIYMLLTYTYVACTILKRTNKWTMFWAFDHHYRYVMFNIMMELIRSR